MKWVLYVSKMNLRSHHILEALEDRNVLTTLLSEVYSKINDEVSVIRTDVNNIDGEDMVTYNASYKFDNLRKHNDGIIVGDLLKTTTTILNQYDESEHVVVPVEQEYSEMIHFYFDVFNERICYYKKRRFGHSEFNTALTLLINEIINQDNDENYEFEFENVKQGATFENIKEELRGFGKLRSLEIDVKPPNPDGELLDHIEEDLEDYLQDIVDGHITHRSTLFESKDPRGINLDSKIVNTEFDLVDNMHSKLTAEVAIQNNYIEIKATTKNGRKYSTKKLRELTLDLKSSEKMGEGFVNVCRRLISLARR